MTANELSFATFQPQRFRFWHKALLDQRQFCGGLFTNECKLLGRTFDLGI